MTPRVVLLELAHLSNKAITALQHFVKITIIYDNQDFKKELAAGWGFSILVEAENTPKILFNTGANGQILPGKLKEEQVK